MLIAPPPSADRLALWARQQWPRTELSGRRIVGRPLLIKRQDDASSTDRDVPMQGTQLAIGY